MKREDPMQDIFGTPEDNSGSAFGMAMEFWEIFQNLMSVGFERDEAFDLLLMILQKG